MAKVYEKLTTGTAVKPIRTMLEGLNDRWPFSKAEAILDNGCGPGPIMARILKDYAIPESCSLTCSDFSDGMIKAVNTKKAEAVEADSKSPWSRVETMKQDAMNLESIKDSSQSHITAGWVRVLLVLCSIRLTLANNLQVYFMTPDPQKCLSESKRVLRDGGVLTCSSWHGSQWIDLMNLLPKIRPDKQLPVIPENWKNAEPMKLELEKAGFKDVESQEVLVEMEIDSLEVFVDFILDKMPHSTYTGV
jgi:ubiquinone/menaquinone biosynthesis C-methylase UbiE